MGQRLTGAGSGWRWAAARAAGTSHARGGTPCQDALAAREVEGPAGPVLVAAVSDGAGSAALSRQGSRIVARTVVAEAARHFEAEAAMPDAEAVLGWLDAARDAIAAEAGRRGASPRDFAATMVAAFATPHATLVAHVGDGGCVLDGMEGGWDVASWPAGGEYAGTTFFVTDAPAPRLELRLIERPAAALALFTDGIEHMVLHDATRTAHAPFFDPMFAPVRASAAEGRDRDLSRALRAYLRSAAVEAKTDDDKTLLLAVRA